MNMCYHFLRNRQCGTEIDRVIDSAAAFGEQPCAMPRVLGSLPGEELAKQIQAGGCFIRHSGFCPLLVLPSQVLRLGSSKPDPGWSLGIAQGLEGIRTDKAREPGPPKEDRVGSRKLGLP